MLRAGRGVGQASRGDPGVEATTGSGQGPSWRVWLPRSRPSRRPACGRWPRTWVWVPPPSAGQSKISYVCRHRQLLMDTMKKTRVEKGRKLLSCLHHNGLTVWIFSYKKNWTVDQARNSRNDRYLAYRVHKAHPPPPIASTKHLASTMMPGVVASDGKLIPPYWFLKGLRVGTTEHLDILQSIVKPWIAANYPGIRYV